MKAVFSLAALAMAVNAASVTFRVVAPGATSVQVSVGGQQTTLTASDPDVPYYTGSANLDSGAAYKYVMDGQQEPFDRTLGASLNQTMNDFFGREITYANLPTLPWPIQNDRWTRMGSKTPVFDDNYFPTIFITGDDAAVENLVTTVPAAKIPVKYTFVGPDEVKVFNNCSFGVHHPGGKNNEAKQTWEWSLPEGQDLYGRNWMKARNMEQDPTQIREKLYADILYALGSYSNQANYVRIYINKEGYGTFNLVDDVIQYSFINAVFYGNSTKPTAYGPLYDGGTGASFDYAQESEDDWSAWIPNVSSPEDSTALSSVSKAVADMNPADDASVQNLTSTIIDTDNFLRFMVMEYLTGSWDAYWMMQTNDGAYQDPATKLWYYLPQDFDGTFGLNLDVPLDFVNQSYTTFPTTYPNATLINKLLENPTTKTKFETYLKDTVSVLFNNATLGRRVYAVQDRLKPEVEWDRNITQRSPGVDYHWTYQQFLDNVNEPVNGVGGGGANQWGVMQWIVTKSQLVATEFNLTLPSQPVNGPNTSTSTVSASSASTASTPSGTDKSSAQTSGDSSSSSSSAASSCNSNIVLVLASALVGVFASAMFNF